MARYGIWQLSPSETAGTTYVLRLCLLAILSNSCLICRSCSRLSCRPSPLPNVTRWVGDRGSALAAMRASFLGSPRTSEWTRCIPKSAAWSCTLYCSESMLLQFVSYDGEQEVGVGLEVYV